MDNILINKLRITAVRMIENAKSGHPGIALGTAPLFYNLYAHHINVIPDKPIHFLRDRFVVCSGHASAILYATLNMFGYDISAEDLKHFRQINSKTCGLPNMLVTPGVDCTTGALGQGVASAVGMAIAERMMASRFNKPDCELFDNHTYALLGEGSLMEGVAYESLSLAGSLRLNKLIVFMDNNNITIEGSTDNVFNMDVRKTMEGMGFNVLEVDDINNIDALNNAIQKAKKSTNKPTFIILHSTIGYGSHMQGIAKVHGTPLGEKGINQLRENLGYNDDEFTLTKAENDYIKQKKKRYVKIEKVYAEKIEYYKKNHKREWAELIKYLNNDYKKLRENINKIMVTKDASLRDLNGELLNRIADLCPNIISGSADVAPSTKSELYGYKNITCDDFSGRNIRYGVREFGMSSIANGIALYGGLRPFVSTFFVFSDYMKNGMRHSAMMNLPVTYIFTHDSIAVGEDGITHQPIEQLWGLRCMPNLNVFRPADFNELKAGLFTALTSEKPTALVLCRQEVKFLNTPFDKALYGAYVIKHEKQKKIDCILIATGSEVELALDVVDMLENKGFSIRVVSMPCTNIFDMQSEKYKESVLPKSIKNRVAIELGSDCGWYKYVGLDGKVFGINHFGESGDYKQILNKYDFTKENITREIIKYLKK